MIYCIHFCVGPLIHFVIWQNANDEWQLALDTSDMYEEGSSNGKLEDFKPLSEFHLHQDYRTLSSEDACNFGMHVYDEGNVLSIFVGAGSLLLFLPVSLWSCSYIRTSSSVFISNPQSSFSQFVKIATSSVYQCKLINPSLHRKGATDGCETLFLHLRVCSHLLSHNLLWNTRLSLEWWFQS